MPRPPAFVQYLRSHTIGARVGGVRLIADDRQLALRLRTDVGDFDLLLAIFGARSNIYLLSVDGPIVVSLRPLNETRPELQIGDPWRSPEPRPFGRDEDRFEAETDDRFLFAIEAMYAEVEQAGDVDELRRRIERALRKEAKSLDRKLAKLEKSLEEARTASRLERDGELLKSVLSQVKRGDSEIIATDFETGEPVASARASTPPAATSSTVPAGGSGASCGNTNASRLASMSAGFCLVTVTFMGGAR